MFKHRYGSTEQRRDPVGTAPCTSDCICSIALACDTTFFTGPDGNNNAEYATSTMISRMMWVNGVYRNTSFGGVTGYGFIVAKIIIYSTNSGSNPVTGTSYTSTTFLQAFSSANIWTPFCLAHMYATASSHFFDLLTLYPLLSGSRAERLRMVSSVWHGSAPLALLAAFAILPTTTRFALSGLVEMHSS